MHTCLSGHFVQCSIVLTCVTGSRYITHFYCLAVEESRFYSKAVAVCYILYLDPVTLAC